MGSVVCFISAATNWHLKRVPSVRGSVLTSRFAQTRIRLLVGMPNVSVVWQLALSDQIQGPQLKGHVFSLSFKCLRQNSAALAVGC